jgi:hypothetical protein
MSLGMIWKDKKLHMDKKLHLVTYKRLRHLR